MLILFADSPEELEKEAEEETAEERLRFAAELFAEQALESEAA